METSPRQQWPYPSAEDDPWYDSFEDLINAMDASGYASREDRHAILAGGTSVSWDAGTPALTWAGAIQITSPITGYLWQVPADSAALDDGDVLYAVLNRGPGSNTNVAWGVASTVPSTDEAMVLAIRIGTDIWWRNGLKMENGDALPDLGSGAGGGSTDLRTAPIIVGNTGAGDTADNADYLDTGNGAQLFVALAAAVSGQEVYIRPGTYNLGTIGSPAAPLAIPAGVTVRGAGRLGSIIQTKASGDMGAFTVADDAAIQDVGINVALPTGAGSGSTSVVLMSGNRSRLTRVRVTFLGVYGAPQAGNLVLRTAYRAANGIDDAVMEDVEVTDAPSLRALSVLDDLKGIDIVGGTNDPATFVKVVRPVVRGGDIGCSVFNRSAIIDPTIVDSYRYGINAELTASDSEIRGGVVINDAPAAAWSGIRLAGTVVKVAISGTRVRSTGNPASSVGIEVTGSASRCRIWGAMATGLATGLFIDTGGPTRNVGIANVFEGNTTPIDDQGTFSDLAHNITA